MKTVAGREQDAERDELGQTAQVNGLLERALDCMVEGDAAGAVRAFEQVLALEPHHPEAGHGLVRALEDAGRAEEALRVTEQLIAKDPEDVLAVTRLSCCTSIRGGLPRPRPQRHGRRSWAGSRSCAPVKR